MQGEENPLREFMYLDEVSVTSLMSSRKGAIPSEITETFSTSARTEATRAAESDLKVLKISGGSVLESTQTKDRQVLRKATIQATFRDLHLHEQNKLALAPIPPGAPVPTLSQIRGYFRSPEQDSSSQWFISPQRLNRGDLVEVEVELQADPIFQVSTFLSSFLDMITDSEELTGQVDQTQAAKVREFNAILERLRVGLIPIRCRIIDYRTVRTIAGDCLVHRRVLEELPQEERPTSYPTYLVAVTEQDLYWKDTRRILFANAEVRILCRLNRAGIQLSWNAVKLADMVGSVLPEFSEMMSNLGTEALQAMMNNSQDSSVSEQEAQVLVIFAQLVAGRNGINLDDSATVEIERLAQQNAHLLSAGDLDQERIAFSRLLEYMQSQHGATLEADQAVNLRAQARSQVALRRGLTLRPASAVTSPTTEAGRFLDSEVIAIYW
ncbi:DUF6414 family protein [Streptomyces olivaceus]|uniref:DUF6414 family protein n=1 Tax=Streptomyces olivaceus TaxID=47716 RepID=UPI001CCAC94D|nr:hypothetical protein [Streptomyces olivaceus]MBZ6137115.1 hypothetical protein [Streptomyces olivaceus]MBZ6164185.1 hypothetical protein [Streptomyces olivaceus]